MSDPWSIRLQVPSTFVLSLHINRHHIEPIIDKTWLQWPSGVPIYLNIHLIHFSFICILPIYNDALRTLICMQQTVYMMGLGVLGKLPNHVSQVPGSYSGLVCPHWFQVALSVDWDGVLCFKVYRHQLISGLSFCSCFCLWKSDTLLKSYECFYLAAYFFSSPIQVQLSVDFYCIFFFLPCLCISSDLFRMQFTVTLSM